jgi:TatA/E family protein of Tat protein translocase
MFNIGPMELIVILLVALLVVGPARLPDIGKSIGKGLREFRKATDEVRYSFESSLDEEEPEEVKAPSPNGAKPADTASTAEPEELT